MKQTVVIGMLVVSGLCFLPACFSRDYILVEKEMSWADGRDHCRGKYNDLASVHNQQDAAKLNELVENTPVWIGLTPGTGEWRWSLEDQSGFHQGETEFRMWKDGEPSGSHPQACAIIDKNGTWVEKSCDDQFNSFCYDAGSSSNSLHVLWTQTWKDSRNECKKDQADLAVVRKPSENTRMKERVIIEGGNVSSWIGLYRNLWDWSDGSMLLFSSWSSNASSGNVSGSCGASVSGQWIDYDCNKTLKFVCYTEPIPVKTVRKVVRVTLKKTGSSGNIEDMKDDILEMLHQKLKEDGLGEGVKLRWVTQPDGKIFHKTTEKKKEEESCDKPTR